MSIETESASNKAKLSPRGDSDTTGAFGGTFTVVSKNCEISFKNGADQLSNCYFLIEIFGSYC